MTLSSRDGSTISTTTETLETDPVTGVTASSTYDERDT